MEFHSGAILETHDLVPYQSLGASRGLMLAYDSERADPRPILHFGFDNTPADPARRLVAKLSFSRDGFTQQTPGLAGGQFGLTGGEHFWSLPGGNIDGALQGDLRGQPSGRYDYALSSGLLRLRDQLFSGSLADQRGQLIHVNSIGSSFGNGWGLAGLQELVENRDGSVLLIDGDSSELIFEPPAAAGGPYVSPPGDFSTLERLVSGIFRRTMTDQTVYTFDAQNRLERMRDRNGNETRYAYDAAGVLTKVTDPVGLETIFSSTQGRISSITDPAGRVTRMAYDAAGNLTSVTDPDGSRRTWGYDGDRHITSEIDQRGQREETSYHFSGRAIGGVRKDGSVLRFTPVQIQGLYSPEATIDPLQAPAAFRRGAAEANYMDGNGNVVRKTLDQAGQEVASFDGVGPLPTMQRNTDNLVTQLRDGRGHKTDYSYDDKGNLLSIRDTPTATLFTETAGQVVVEAEHFSSRTASAATNWLVVPGENPGVFPAIKYRGTGFLQLLPEAGAFNGDPLGKAEPYVDYKIHINTPGIYQLYMRAASFDLGSDSFYARIVELNDGPGNALADFYQFTPFNGADFSSPWDGTAGFEALNGYPSEVSANWNVSVPGDYTLRVSMREDGTMLDSFVLQLANLPAPTGDGPPETTPDAGSGTVQKSFTYDPTYSQIATITDEVGRQTHFDIDPANGNVLSTTRVVGAVGGADDVVTRMTYTAEGLLATTTDPNGHVTGFDYDPLGRLITMTEAVGTPEQGVTRFEHDAAGNITASIDENGNRTTYQYDAMNRWTRLTEADPDAAGPLTAPVTQRVYDPAGNLVSLTDARSHITQLTYDPMDRLSSTTDAIGGISRLNYDPAGNVISSVDELGREMRYRYDSRNRLVETIDAAGGHAFMQYDADDNPIFMADENGHATRLAYDARSRLVRITDALGKVAVNEYNAADDLIAVIDRNAHKTQFAYDDLGRRTTMTDARGGLMSYAYDPAGNIVAVTDELNRRTQSIYDARNRGTSITSPLGNTVRYVYDAASNLTEVRDGLNQATQYAYDALNRLARRTDALNGVMTYVYDTMDNVVAMTDELARTWQYAYDDLDRQTSMTDPLGHVTRMAYDAVDNLVSSTDGVGQVTRFDYDVLDRQAKITDARNGISRFTYDAVGNLLSLTDSVNNTTRFAYDALDRLARETNPLGADRIYGYDAVGNLKSLTDRNGRVRRFTYDELDRQTQEQWLDAASNLIRTINYTFNATSQLTAAADPDSAYAYLYDLDGRPTSASNDGTPGVPSVVFGYSYDAADNLLTRTDTVAGQLSGTNGYAYDALNRSTRITQSGVGVQNKRVDLAYDAAGQMTGVTRFADLAGAQSVAASTYTYDADSRLTGLTHARGATTLAAYAWTFDAADRIAQATSPDGSSNYAYDSTNQLTAADHSFQTDEGYSYDLNGNRTNTGYQTDPNNRLKTDGTFNYEYDAEGNRTRRIEIATGRVLDYEWDLRNRLTRVVSKDSGGSVTQEVRYTYDVVNRRIAKAVDPDGPGPNPATVVRHVYDGAHIVLSYDGAGLETHRYLHGPIVDQILADEDATGQVLWPLTDHQGTVRDLVDSTGAIRNHLSYDSFGRVTSETNVAIDHLFGFTGREPDAETGLSFYRARYYDPAVGRFTSEDPLPARIDDPSTWNAYHYVRNAPIRFTDPAGLEPIVPNLVTAEEWLSSFRRGTSPLNVMNLLRNQFGTTMSQLAAQQERITGGQTPFIDIKSINKQLNELWKAMQQQAELIKKLPPDQQNLPPPPPAPPPVDPSRKCPTQKIKPNALAQPKLTQPNVPPAGTPSVPPPATPPAPRGPSASSFNPSANPPSILQRIGTRLAPLGRVVRPVAPFIGPAVVTYQVANASPANRPHVAASGVGGLAGGAGATGAAIAFWGAATFSGPIGWITLIGIGLGGGYVGSKIGGSVVPPPTAQPGNSGP